MRKEITIVDSHTAGEPTRLVVDGMPDLGGGMLCSRLEVFRQKYDLQQRWVSWYVWTRSDRKITPASHAWGGNWFYLIEEHGLKIHLSNVDELTRYTIRVRRALADNDITGQRGANIDHIELFSPTDPAKADARNFVLCPGNAYDRSPCGTGTSAKLACLYEDGKLSAGQQWRQESIIGGVFRGFVEIRENRIYPFVRGAAHVTLRGSLVIDEDDPFAWGIGANR
jgi:4-hydroxyproline epimerase